MVDVLSPPKSNTATAGLLPPTLYISAPRVAVLCRGGGGGNAGEHLLYLGVVGDDHALERPYHLLLVSDAIIQITQLGTQGHQQVFRDGGLVGEPDLMLCVLLLPRVKLCM